MSLRVLVVAGARPNFMKVAPILRALEAAGHERVLVHTGQHYDARMSDTFFTELDLPDPDYHLSVGSGSHAVQTARVMEAFEPVLLGARADWLVVVGDVNSTLACALVASKLKEQTGTRIAHVEAGLRSGDWRMPEEVNRVLTDRLADLLLTPSRDAHPNLAAEGIEKERVVFVGNVMMDTLFQQLTAAREMRIASGMGITERRYALVTLHRPSNVDDPVILRAVLEALGQLANRLPIVFPIHPRTRAAVEAGGLHPMLAKFEVLDPLSYREMLSLTDTAAVVLTDSGGLQEETTALGIPCVTLREGTERPATITHGSNRLVRWPITADGILASTEEAVARGRLAIGARLPEGWEGGAATRIVEALGRTSRGQ